MRNLGMLLLVAGIATAVLAVQNITRQPDAALVAAPFFIPGLLTLTGALLLCWPRKRQQP
jgi:hypothetical protein